MVTVKKLPKLGSIMKEGTISKMLVKEGDKIAAGQAMYEVSTSKITNEVESDVDGIVRKILVGEGETVKCQTPVLIIADTEDEDISAAL